MKGWRIVIPVKDLDESKSRTGLAQQDRRALSLAMLKDVVVTAQRTAEVEEVVLCTREASLVDRIPGVSLWLSESGTLNSDLRALLAGSSAPGSSAATAIVVSDLPCLTVLDLSRILKLGSRDSGAFVASVDGGTTIIAAPDGQRMSIAFGRRSAQAHRRWFPDQSARVAVGARLDVDTVNALMWGTRIGLGPATARFVAAHGTRLHLNEPRLDDINKRRSQA